MMTKMQRILTITSLLALILLPTACSKSTPAHSILPDSIELRKGDVVFRRGNGVTSHAVLAFDKGGFYSHCGIVADSAGTLFIVHAVPGEPDFKGDPDRVKADPPSTFFSNVYAQAGEVCRMADSQTAGKAADTAWAIYQRHVLFDHDYDAADTTKMYCTEFVHYVYSKAGCELCGPPTFHFKLPGIDATCWLPSDIYHSVKLSSVSKFDEETP